MNKKYNSICALMLTFFICVSSLNVRVTTFVFANEIADIIISTEEDFINFAKNCKSDYFSENKTVLLNNDLDFTNIDLVKSEFYGVPIFLGEFNGNGHTITIDYINVNSFESLFWKLGGSGVIKNLNIVSNLETENTEIGGIVSKNEGTIENSSFNGSIEGINNVGGIASINDGFINNCQVYGNISGISNVGGITGENNGSIQNSSNFAIINEDINKLNTTSENNISSSFTIQSDNIFNIGGIVGNNNGIVENSDNNGIVGYSYVGMNIGGIAGYNIGVLKECKNNSTIYGRSQVGGIVGWFEPYVEIIYSDSKIDEFRIEINQLNDKIDELAEVAKNSNTNISENGDIFQEHLKETKTETEFFMSEIEYIFDGNIDVINEISSIVSETIDGFVPVVDSLDDIENSLLDTLTYFEQMSDEIGLSMENLEELEEVEKNIRIEIENVNDNIEELNKSFSNILDEFDNIDDAIDEYDLVETLEVIPTYILESTYAINRINDVINDITKVLENYADYFVNVSNNFSQVLSLASISLGDIQVLLNSYSNLNEQILISIQNLSNNMSFGNIGIEITAIRNTLAQCSYNMNIFNNGIGNLRGSISWLLSIINNSDLNDWNNELFDYLETGNIATSDLIEQITYINEAIVEAQNYVDTDSILDAINEIRPNIRTAQDYIFDAISYFNNAIELTDEITDILSESGSYIQNANDNMADGINKLKETVENLGVTSDLFQEVVEKLSEKDDIIFVKTGETYDIAKDNMSNSIDSMGNSVSDLMDTVTNSTDNVLDEFSNINDQFYIVQNVMLDIIDEMKNFDLKKSLEVNLMDYEKSLGFSKGKILNSYNYSIIQGDSNIGGIVGKVGFSDNATAKLDELFKDIDFSNNITKEGIALIESCTNVGFISGRKNNIGGIIGFGEFGIIQSSISSGIVTSDEGNNVGGIAGYSQGKIQNNYAKNVIEGNEYIGGIAGFGYDIFNNYALTVLNSDARNIGSIVGAVDDEGVVSNNYFVNDDIGGISGISYIGLAESISYEELCQIENMPNVFFNMNVQFFTDDILIENFSVDFNGSLDESLFPEIPYKEGYFGSWSEFDNNYINSDILVSAQYFPLVSTLTSDITENNLPVVLVNGEFTDSEKLYVDKNLDTKENDIFAQYVIYLDGENKDIKNIRFLLPDENINLQVLHNDVWVDVETTKDGKYVVFSPFESSSKVEFRGVVDIQEFNNINIWVLSIFTIGSICTLILKKPSKNQ